MRLVCVREIHSTERRNKSHLLRAARGHCKQVGLRQADLQALVEIAAAELNLSRPAAQMPT